MTLLIVLTSIIIAVLLISLLITWLFTDYEPEGFSRSYAREMEYEESIAREVASLDHYSDEWHRDGY